jgi:hypothetical protein
MKSLYDEVAGKLGADSRNVGPRADIGLLLYSRRDALRDLWVAADRYERVRDAEALAALHAAIESLRPLFGERAG